MTRPIVLLFPLLLGQTPIPMEPEKPTILLVGDSLAAGVTPEFVRLGEARGYRAIGDGRVGTRVGHWIRWVTPVLRRYHPRVVLVSLGTNDMGGEGGMVRNPNLVNELLQRIDRESATVVWILPPSFPKGKFPYEAEVRSALGDRVPKTVDASRIVFKRAEDEVHGTPEGYRALMDEVWEECLRNGWLP